MYAYRSEIFVWSLGNLFLFPFSALNWLVSVFIFRAWSILYFHFFWCNQVEILQLRYYRSGYINFGTTDILSCVILKLCRVLACDCRMFSSIPGLLPLDVSSTYVPAPSLTPLPQVITIKSVFRFWQISLRESTSPQLWTTAVRDIWILAFQDLFAVLPF